MGSSNYVIIDELKMAIEITRYVDCLEPYEQSALEEITQIDCGDENIVNKKVSDLTVADLQCWGEMYKKVMALQEMHPVKFLLFWLTQRNVAYEIISEYELDTRKDEFENYKIWHRYY